ncbi:MAG: bifunctional folylpolyglutamate synthase/dihydrofolate synthase [Desulfobulbaceae bacterium]|mgnify:CR=1 FL=1|nr:MAG: bifunctional folylpolyglutamate synthase/dihydrofolate synthase [Desulfobulbaceae bacterium]
MTTQPLTTFAVAVKYLDDLQMHKIKLGLDAMRAVLTSLDSPEKSCPAVHVAGTNGKGSTCSILQNIMSRADYRVGLYTSPHLDSVRERFRINDHYISEEAFTRHMERICRALDGKTITYFECATALAFSWFAEQQCDLVIIETGMGGRLDATNVLTPLLTIITSISLDHEQYLGDTIEAVAFEKAGIIKEEIPLISGVTDQNAQEVIRQACIERGAPLRETKKHFSIEKKQHGWFWQLADGTAQLGNIEIGRPGQWQHENTSCAITAAMMLRDKGYEISADAIRDGVKHTKWPGRMEYLEKTHQGTSPIRFLLDGAHNSEGIDHLLASLDNDFDYQTLYVIWASMADKNFTSMMQRVAQQADQIILTAPESERSARPNDLFTALSSELKAKANIHSTVEAALNHVYRNATNQDLVVVAGSLYLIGELRKQLVGEVVNG